MSETEDRMTGGESDWNMKYYTIITERKNQWIVLWAEQSVVKFMWENLEQVICFVCLCVASILCPQEVETAGQFMVLQEHHRRLIKHKQLNVHLPIPAINFDAIHSRNNNNNHHLQQMAHVQGGKLLD